MEVKETKEEVDNFKNCESKNAEDQFQCEVCKASLLR